MISTFLLSILLSLEAQFTSAATDCLFNVEFVIVQDVSSGANGEKQQHLAEEIKLLAEKLDKTFPSIEIGLATFVDKPIAYLGWSNEYGGHTEPDDSDWCYRKEAPMTSDFDTYHEILVNARTGAGVDVPEAQYEGILRAALDSSLGWTDPSIDWLADGSAPLRAMLLVTDSAMHLAGEGQKSLDMWASQYGTQAWCDMPVISDKTLCAEAIELKLVIDSGSATEEEEARWEYIQSVLGPPVFPAMKTHPGNLTGNDGCIEYDYPDWQFMVSVLEEKKINPIYALISTEETSGYDNWLWLSQQYGETNISAYLLSQPDFTDLSTILSTVVETVSEDWCQVLPDPPESTEPETTKSEADNTNDEIIHTETTDEETIGSEVIDTETVAKETTGTEVTDITDPKTDTIRTEIIETATVETATFWSETAEIVDTTETSLDETLTTETASSGQTTSADSSTSDETGTLPEELSSTSSTGTSCRLDVELTVVMDVSSSEVTQDDLPVIADNILTLSQLLSAKYPMLHMALTTFVDKPIAYLGYSAEYGGHPNIATDWCYRQVTPLTQDFKSLTEAIRGMVIGGGADPQEAQYEGIIRTALDSSLGWTDPSVDWLDDGTVPLRIMFMMTDNAMHLMGDGPASIERWANEYGTQAWCDQPLISDKELCAEAVELKPIIDEGSATSAELERWDYIQSVLGPVYFPPMQVHPGNLTGNDGCTEYDYPDWPLVVNALEERKINPIFALFSEDDSVAAGWQWISDQFTSVSSHFLYNIPVSGISDVLEQLIDEIGVEWCNRLPTFP